jgi:hypothetical protein
MSLCGAKHSEKDATCQREPHDEGNHVQWCPVVVWRDGEEDSSEAVPLRASRDRYPVREDNNAVCGVMGGRREDEWRPDGGRTWRWL